MEAVPPLGSTFPTPGGREQDWCTWIPQVWIPSTSSTGCESGIGAELLCAHLSPRPGSPVLPLSELGLSFIPWLPQLGLLLLDWKSALVCQPSPELSSAHTAQLWLCTVPMGTQIHAGSSSWEPPEGRCWDRHQEFSSIPSLPPCPLWYADPAGTILLPAGVWSLLPFISITIPSSCAHLGPKSLLCSQSPPASPAACMRRAWQCPW